MLKPLELRCIQWNCKSFFSKLSEITSMSRDMDVILLSETWLEEKHNTKVRDFEIVRKDRVHRRGGVAILIRKSLKFSVVESVYDCDGGLEVCAVRIFRNKDEIVLVSCYNAPGVSSITAANWSKFFDQFPDKVIFCGDFNSHHTAWGSKRCCTSGVRLMKGLEDSGLTFVNDGNPTYFDIAKQVESTIDLTICNKRQFNSSLEVRQ